MSSLTTTENAGDHVIKYSDLSRQHPRAFLENSIVYSTLGQYTIIVCINCGLFSPKARFPCHIRKILTIFTRNLITHCCSTILTKGVHPPAVSLCSSFSLFFFFYYARVLVNLELPLHVTQTILTTGERQFLCKLHVDMKILWL